MNYTNHYDSPLGPMTMLSDGSRLLGLWFDGQKYALGRYVQEPLREAHNQVFDTTRMWLDTYFGGHVPDFLPPLEVEASAFRRLVCDILLTIPHGTTTTYGAIADEVAIRTGRRRMSAQAIGGAVGHNPISIIIPCHRVLAADGSLTGYAGGMDRKAWLLGHEGIRLRK